MLLFALALLGRVYVGPAAGAYGWMAFFFLTFLVALPGVALLWWLRLRIDSLDDGAKT